MKLSPETKETLVKTLITIILLTIVIMLSYSIGYDDGLTNRVRVINNQHEKLMTRYINEGYEPLIAKHLTDVELGIIPIDDLYKAIKDD